MPLTSRSRRRTSRRRWTILTTIPAVVAVGAVATAPAYAGRTEPRAGVADEAVAYLVEEEGLTQAQAHDRLRGEDRANATLDTLRAALGDRITHAELDAQAALTVHVSDADAARTVRAAGATAVLDDDQGDRQQLTAEVAEALDDLGVQAAVGVDITDGTLDVQVPDDAPADVEALVTEAVTAVQADLDLAAEVTRVEEAPTPSAAYLRGGDKITRSDGVACTAGFTFKAGTTRYMLIAGHCTVTNYGWGYWAPNGLAWSFGTLPLGKPAQMRWNAEGDWALIKVDDPTKVEARPTVRTGTGFLSVRGVQTPAVGTTVCRYGVVSGYACGTIEAYNQAQYGATNLIRVGLCNTSGDSGGPLYRVSNGAAYAVGIVSVGSGCSGDVTRDGWYSPVQATVTHNTLGATLLTNP